MAAKLSQCLEDNVTCPICLDQYQDPRILPCLHTYCRRCLEDMMDKGTRRFSIQCPECREIVEVEDVASLKVNIWINKTLSVLELSKTADKKQDNSKPETVCNNCDSNEAANARCFDCERFVCDFCITAHRRMSTLREHQLMTLEEIKDKGIPVMEKPPLCERHKGEVKKLYCKTCEGLNCRDCIIIDHKEHDFYFVEDIVNKRKEEIIEVIQKTSEVKDKVGVCVKSVPKMQEELKKKGMDTEERIHKVINQQMNALEAQRTTLLQRTRNKTSIAMKQLSAKEDDCTMHVATLTSAIEFTENLLTKGNNSDIMSLSVEVMTRLSQLAAKPQWTCQVDVPELEVKEKLIMKEIPKISSVEYDIKVLDLDDTEKKNTVTQYLKFEKCCGKKVPKKKKKKKRDDEK